MKRNSFRFILKDLDGFLKKIEEERLFYKRQTCNHLRETWLEENSFSKLYKVSTRWANLSSLQGSYSKFTSIKSQWENYDYHTYLESVKNSIPNEDGYFFINIDKLDSYNFNNPFLKNTNNIINDIDAFISRVNINKNTFLYLHPHLNTYDLALHRPLDKAEFFKLKKEISSYIHNRLNELKLKIRILIKRFIHFKINLRYRFRIIIHILFKNMDDTSANSFFTLKTNFNMT